MAVEYKGFSIPTIREYMNKMVLNGSGANFPQIVLETIDDSHLISSGVTIEEISGMKEQEADQVILERSKLAIDNFLSMMEKVNQ